MKTDQPESREPHGETKRKVSITINGKDYQIPPGNHPVSGLKNIPQPHIPKEDTLCLLVDGELKPLNDRDHVQIKGGEVFASNCPSGGAS